MSPLASLRRIALGLAGTLFASALLAFAVRAAEPAGAASAGGVVIHGPAKVLRDFCRFDAEGRLWLTLPGGVRSELVTSASDPAIPNPGDGSFHAFEEGEVRAALAAVAFPLERVRVEVLLLPYPRRGALSSAAARRWILLSPGVRPLTRGHQHAEFVHELGHAVHFELMPDADAGRWTEYRRLRGIEDASVYAAGAQHENRPHEIFAEDFRVLFGGAPARESGTIENPQLALPAEIPGLEAFLRDLALAPPRGRTLSAFPNPARGTVEFSRPGSAPAPLEIYDLSGRRLAVLSPLGAGPTVTWRWDGRDARGRALGPGVVFARVRGAAREGSVRVLLRP